MNLNLMKQTLYKQKKLNLSQKNLPRILISTFKLHNLNLQLIMIDDRIVKKEKTMISELKLKKKLINLTLKLFNSKIVILRRVKNQFRNQMMDHMINQIKKIVFLRMKRLKIMKFNSLNGLGVIINKKKNHMKIIHSANSTIMLRNKMLVNNRLINNKKITKNTIQKKIIVIEI